MSPWKSTAALTLSFLALNACSESGDSAPMGGSVNQALSYELSENGCTTGRQNFTSQTEMCVGLQNNTLNNNCALNLRASHFQRSCSGQNFSPFEAPVGDPNNPYPNQPDLNQPYPNHPYPNPNGASSAQAEVQVSGFRNLYYRLDANQGAGSVECYTRGRELNIRLEHPQYMNFGEQGRLLELRVASNSRRFPTRASIDGNSPGGALTVILPGTERNWSPRRQDCEVNFRRRGSELQADFDCDLVGRQQGRNQTARVRASITCELERR